jgi:DNA-binding PadR family transcriptional regulator
VSRRYGPPDTRTEAEKLADREARYTAILDILSGGFELTPNEIGQQLHHSGHRVPDTLGHSGKRLGPGSAIASTLRALDRRRWIRFTPRTDGLSGTAYIITQAGRQERARRKREAR